jgi:hypothetical protein
MRHGFVVGVVIALETALLVAAAPPRRRPLDTKEREAILTLMKAVDLAQQTDVLSDAGLAWSNHVLKSGDQTAYVPFRLTIDSPELKSPAMYVRAVSRHDGMRASDEHSSLREWLLHGSSTMPRMPETVWVGLGEMPIGGLAIASSRQATAAAAAASGALLMQQRDYEKQKAADEAAKKRAETKERDPFLFPYEDYFFFDLRSAHSVERALALPPGEYDIYVGLIDRTRVKTSGPQILKRTVVIPDFWSDRLMLSSLMLVREVRPLNAPLQAAQQVERPFAFGQAEVVPVPKAAFTPDDALSVVYQICNYGAPDADLRAEYNFFVTTNGSRRLFNRTEPQVFADADLPPPQPWTNQAFALQAVSLKTFPPGQYELEVIVRDRLTRASATGSVAFTVGVR